jgi:four helix bundle protein
MDPFRRLSVWRKAHLLAVATCRMSAVVIAPQLAWLAARLCEVATDIPAGIAAGAAASSAAGFQHHLERALHRARELDYLFLLADDLGALARSDRARLEARADEVCRMLVVLRARLCARDARPRPVAAHARSGAQGMETGRVPGEPAPFAHPSSGRAVGLAERQRSAPPRGVRRGLGPEGSGG